MVPTASHIQFLVVCFFFRKKKFVERKISMLFVQATSCVPAAAQPLLKNLTASDTRLPFLPRTFYERLGPPYSNGFHD